MGFERMGASPQPAALVAENRGLSTADVAERVAKGQTNAVPAVVSRSVWDIVRANVLTLFNAIVAGSFGGITPEMRVTFALGARYNVLLVPGSAVIGAQGNEAVFVVEDGKAVRRAIETGVTSQGNVEIVSGLAEGDQVVTVGNNLLRDGMAVRSVVNDSTLANPRPQDGAAQ